MLGPFVWQEQSAIGSVLPAPLGLKMTLTVDPETTTKSKEDLTGESARPGRGVGALAGTKIIELTPDFSFRRARAGGLARERLPNLSEKSSG